MEIDYNVIGKRIHDLRLSKKMTQATLAEKVDIEPSHISHIERGATKLSLPTLISIANVLDTTLDELVYNNLVKCSHVSAKLMDDQLQDCSADELIALVEIVKATKKILRSRNEKF